MTKSYTKKEILALIKSAPNFYEDNKRFFHSIKKRELARLDRLFHQHHEQIFEQINCLDCANCCSTTSPRLFMTDINRAARELRQSSSTFINRYVGKDEDNDYVFHEQPCPFLDIDNYCCIYKNRPLACKEYPHTNRKKIYQILDITLANSLVCPAVLLILEHVKLDFK